MARYKFLSISLWACLLVFSKVSAQSKLLKGKVIDAQSRELVPGAIILVEKQFAVSNENAEFSIQLPVKHEIGQNLIVRCIGYQEFVIPLLSLDSISWLVVNLKQEESILEMIIISAGRYEQSLKKMMVSTEVIQPYLIQNRNTTMMDKMLDQIPSVNITDGQINIRSGSGWTYGAGSRVAVLLDDLPFLTGDAGQVKWNFVPIENVKQVEVVKGASSVLYGSSALSGIVHFRTELATSKPITRFNTFTGIYSDPKRSSLKWTNTTRKQYGASAFHSFKWKKLQTALSGNYFRDEGYRMGDNDNRFRVNTNLKYNFSKKGNVGLNLGALISDGASFLLWENFEKGYTILDSQTTSTRSNNFCVDPYLNFYTGALKHRIQGRWMYISNDITNPNPAINQDNSSQNIYAEYQLQRYYSGIRATVTGGLVSSLNFSNSPLYSGYQKSSNQAVFFQWDQPVKKRLNLSAGARYEYFNMNGQTEGKPVFRAGLNLELAKATFLRSSFGQGYRFPSIAERYVQTSVGLINIFPNPSLKSETGWNLELGIKQGFSSKKAKGFLDLAFFLTRYQNMIDFNLGIWKPIADPFNPFPSFGFKSLNIGNSQILGLDFSSNAEFSIGKIKCQTLFGYTYTKPIVLNVNEVYAIDSINQSYSYRSTRSDSSNILKYRFQHLLKWDMQANYQKWQMGYSLRYNSYMANIDKAFYFIVGGITEGRKANAGGNVVLDFRVSYQLPKNLKIALVINNVLNAEIMTRPADLRPPRLTQIQLSYSL